tara:strand:- start:10362 stop:10595 length:234 start_codon:yes stop_codon:yes gene_type:complete
MVGLSISLDIPPGDGRMVNLKYGIVNHASTNFTPNVVHAVPLFFFVPLLLTWWMEPMSRARPESPLHRHPNAGREKQ